MSKSYVAALADLDKAARLVLGSRPLNASHEIIALADALGRVAAIDVLSPISTPEFDVSAMDGYAVRSVATAHASPETPVRFRVRGTIAVGDDPKTVMEDTPYDGLDPCMEIMTGARFPRTGMGARLDACVKLEDVTVIPSSSDAKAKHGRLEQQPSILITSPVSQSANIRFAGDDIREGDVILAAGKTIRPCHLIPLVSVGADTVPVARRPHAGIWSTGGELAGSGSICVRDVNIPFLTAWCRDFGASSRALGVLDDNLHVVAAALKEQADKGHFDLLVASGGVSVGKLDVIAKALDLVNADIIFHGFNVWLGHPALFALIPGNKGKVAFFGLPGNPAAAAVCFRFLVVPFVRFLLGQVVERPIIARLRQPEGTGGTIIRNGVASQQGHDAFRLGVLERSEVGETFVSEVEKLCGSAKLLPFVSANCWIHFSPDHQSDPEQLLRCYPTSTG